MAMPGALTRAPPAGSCHGGSVRGLLGCAAAPVQPEPHISSPWARGVYVSPISIQSMIVAGGMYATQELSIFWIN